MLTKNKILFFIQDVSSHMRWQKFKIFIWVQNWLFVLTFKRTILWAHWTVWKCLDVLKRSVLVFCNYVDKKQIYLFIQAMSTHMCWQKFNFAILVQKWVFVMNFGRTIPPTSLNHCYTFWMLWKVQNQSHLWLCKQKTLSKMAWAKCVDKNSVWLFWFKNGFLSPYGSLGTED